MRIWLIAARDTVALYVPHHAVARGDHRRCQRLLQLLLLLAVFGASILKPNLQKKGKERNREAIKALPDFKLFALTQTACSHAPTPLLPPAPGNFTLKKHLRGGRKENGKRTTKRTTTTSTMMMMEQEKRAGKQKYSYPPSNLVPPLPPPPLVCLMSEKIYKIEIENKLTTLFVAHAEGG